MNLFEKIYLKMFNAATDALRQIEKGNFGNAKEILRCAQIDCESFYVEMEEDEILAADLAKNDS